ncbi:MAG: DPP IV N-terminal domain-containing protein, partial [Chitinophagaceae bacterium]|nr:DPP IV N-terminal domain-containing protein [Chitinophagaceae bacterium]
MRKYLLASLLFFITAITSAQTLGTLTVEKIMRDPKWMGTSPSSPTWSYDGTTLYFLWNPDKAPADSLYYITKENKVPVKASVAEKLAYNVQNNYTFNTARTAYVVAKDGDIFYTDIKTGKTRRIIQTTDTESNPQFSFNETKIIYTRNQNLYAWDIISGETLQLTNIKTGETASVSAPRTGGAPPTAAGNPQEQWLKNDQLQYFQVLKERKEKREAADKYTKGLPKEKELRSISLDDKTLQGLSISP